MGVMGWSYGGYMTAWTITQTDRYRAASVGAGITNAISMYGTQDIPDFFESHFGDEKPWEDPKAYTSRSAVSFVANVKTPTLIQHGGEDHRVPVGQAQELYLALKKVGVETELVLYPRQGHGISEPKLLRDAMLRSFRWFDERVRGR
jgi:dipeptidyl aminopeptidase/acylaminoacyl peptidase